MALTPKQTQFCREYLVDLNATQAAIRAGYQPEERSEYYVYFLTSSIDGHIFYIGKGSGNRSSVHLRKWMNNKEGNGAKALKFQEIYNAGGEVREIIFAGNLREDRAYAVERALINDLRDTGLTNIAGGIVSAEEAMRRKAKALLMSMHPYREWVSRIKPDSLALIGRVFGGAAPCYRLISSNLDKLAYEESRP